MARNVAFRRIQVFVHHWRSRWQHASFDILKLFVRFIPTEQQRLFALTIIIGVVCGVAAVAFHLGIAQAEHVMIERAIEQPAPAWIGWTLLTPTLGGLVAGILLQYIVPDARGSGIPQVKVAYAIKGGRLPFRAVIGKFVIGILQIGSGASLGREGPTVQICAGIASLLGRIAALPRRSLLRLLPVGAAAGIAAAFNAPIAAVTFTIEEVVGDLDQTVLSGVVVAAALAAVIERAILGAHPVFEVPAGYGMHHASSLILYAVLGIAAAFVSIAFTDSLLGLRKWFQGLTVIPPWARPAIGGFVTGALAVTALLMFRTNGITGGGYTALSAALNGNLALRVMLVLCVMKLAATVFSYSSGGAGGIFAPALFIGGMLGGAVGFVDMTLLNHSQQEVGAFALVGMGAVFAGIIRAPITSVLIIFEMTGGYGLILPLMLANMVSFGLARHWRPLPIYEALLDQDGVQLPHHGARAPHALDQLNVAGAMSTTLTTLPADATIQAALEAVADTTYSSFPVVDETGSLVGLVSEARLRRSAAQGNAQEQVRHLVDRRPPVHADDHLGQVVAIMDQWDARQLAVQSREDSPQLVGMVTMSDIVRAQGRAMRATGTTYDVAGPQLSEVGETLAR